MQDEETISATSAVPGMPGNPIPFHTAPASNVRKTLFGGKGWKCNTTGAQIEMWGIIGQPGARYVRISKPLEDGNHSVLAFGMTKEGVALMEAALAGMKNLETEYVL